jgi:hypothetical protein
MQVGRTATVFGMATLTVPSGDLSKALSNAEAWLPARSPVPVALFVVKGHRLTVHVTDTYTAGESSCVAEIRSGGDMAAVEITRADLIALAKRAREDGTRKTYSRITVESGKGVIVHGATDDDKAKPATALAVEGEFRPEWAMLRDLFDVAEKRTPWLLVNPGYLTLFNKVRPDVSGRGVHLVEVPETGAVFGKVGPNFRGLVMTLDEARNEAALGEGGLW